MKLELPFPEIENYIKTTYKLDVKITYCETNKIEVDYLFKIGVTIKEVNDFNILLGYELNWAANMLAKSAKFMTNDSIDKDILHWDTSKKEIKLFLNKVSALDDFLKVFKISKFTFDNNQLLLELI